MSRKHTRRYRMILRWVSSGSLFGKCTRVSIKNMGGLGGGRFGVGGMGARKASVSSNLTIPVSEEPGDDDDEGMEMT